MKFAVTQQGRVATLSEDEKKCFFCKDKTKELYFNEDRKCLVCLDCEGFCLCGKYETMSFAIDKWEMVKG